LARDDELQRSDSDGDGGGGGFESSKGGPRHSVIVLPCTISFNFFDPLLPRSPDFGEPQAYFDRPRAKLGRRKRNAGGRSLWYHCHGLEFGGGMFSMDCALCKIYRV